MDVFLENNISKSVYIHIPFCMSICSYCDFCKLLYNKKLVISYLRQLEKEIDSKYKGEKINTIYIGGGTPSSLDLDELNYLFKIISKFSLDNNYEETIECNFDSINSDKLKLFKKYGVNRLSFGMESTNKNILNILDREESKEEIENKIRLCKRIGFNNINVDLMYAINGEDLNMLKNDLDFLIDLDINHISTYSLIIENNTKLAINNFKYIDQELDSDMYYFIDMYLRDNGFNHYEISNYSKDGFESKHNLIYWRNKEYYGFGLGASGYINNIRYSNTRSFNKYIDGLYEYESEYVSFDDLIEYEVILNLRLRCGIEKKAFKEKFGKDISYFFKYDDLIKDGLLCENGGFIYIPLEKWYIMNSILVKIMEGRINYGRDF